MTQSNHDFQTVFQQFIYKSRYARYLEQSKRREEWSETVSRYVTFIKDHIKENYPSANIKDDIYDQLEEAILTQQVMPSMRALMTAGPALKRDNVAGYNCSYLPIDSFKALDEEMYILMNGTGVGYSVESNYVNQLPVVAEEFHPTDTVIVVDDSRIGWTKSYRELITLLYSGQIPKWDLTRLRPVGARLKTFGGRSSGPEPLNQLFVFTIEIFKKAAGRRLSTLELHDLACMIANIVVVGGVRRSALISLSDLQDDKLRDCKSGAWWNANSQRRLANNSAVYKEKPDIGLFMSEWLSLYESMSGERGIFNRQAAVKVIENANKFRVDNFGPNVRQRETNHDFGCNPCSEILLRPYQFCNLTEVVVRASDTVEDLEQKVRLATILGTFQSTLTNFKYINKKWQKNCEDERLLGVSMTGIMDHEILNGSKSKQLLEKTLSKLKSVAIKTNIAFAACLDIKQSAAITCVKPSGTVSALNDTASGIHPRHSQYYIRYVRNSVNDPVTQLLKDQGVPWELDVMDPNNTVVFMYPIKSPNGAILKKELSAIEHLELWKTYQIYWCEHKPSVTITVKEHEWMEVGAWVYNNFEWMSGVSFLPDDGNFTYKQAPFTTCTEQEYKALLEKMPKTVDWTKLPLYEIEDQTTSVQELACASGMCEI
jgi:ribonucleoside-diphosphate reductase alpha chain